VVLRICNFKIFKVAGGRTVKKNEFKTVALPRRDLAYKHSGAEFDRNCFRH
jgi:hypothetical protein